MRTLLQSKWANTFEIAADLTGHRIRYEPEFRVKDPFLFKFIELLMQASDLIYKSETNVEEARKFHRAALSSFDEKETATPLNEEFHLSKARFYESMAVWERALAETAKSNQQLLVRLDGIKRKLIMYGENNSPHEEVQQ